MKPFNRIVGFMPLAWRQIDTQRHEDHERRSERVAAIGRALATAEAAESSYDGWLGERDRFKPGE
jgi:hypothetical protein